MSTADTQPKSGPNQSKTRSIVSVVLEHGGPVVALGVLTATFMMLEESFRSPANFQNIGRQVAVVAILAVGETFVIVAGGIDLSVGSVAALSGVVAGLTMRSAAVPAHLAVPMGIMVGLAVGAFAGAISGTITEFAGIPSFIVTLGMLGVCAGTAKLLCGGTSVSSLPNEFNWLASANVGRVPTGLIVTLIVVIIGQLVMIKTRFGRKVYALGGNREAARLSGISTRRTSIMTFAASGALAGLAGLVLASRVGSAHATAGQGFELKAVAAAVIGGTSLLGGEGSVLGAFVGALIMAVIGAYLDHAGATQFIQEIVIGAMIVAAVIVDKLRRSLLRG